MSQLQLFAGVTQPSRRPAGNAARPLPRSSPFETDIRFMRLPSHTEHEHQAIQPATVEFLQWGRWSADAPPRFEIERRAQLLRNAFQALCTEPIDLRIQVNGARSRWYYMDFGPPCVTIRLHWWLLQWPSFVGRMSFQTLQAQKLPSNFDRWIGERAADFPGAAKQRTDLVTQGNRIHLVERLAVVSKFLDDPARYKEVQVGWSRRGSGNRPPSTIRLGTMNVRTRTMLIHPVLDEPGVPLYVVDMVVWHELCHWVCPPKEHGRRRSIHHAEFLELERRYPDLDRANQWIRKNFTWLAQNSFTE